MWWQILITSKKRTYKYIKTLEISGKYENRNLIQGEEGGKLKRLLDENNFQILESEIKKFSMFTCRKIN